jgi:flagellar hook-length control protein FliK
MSRQTAETDRSDAARPFAALLDGSSASEDGQPILPKDISQAKNAALALDGVDGQKVGSGPEIAAVIDAIAMAGIAPKPPLADLTVDLEALLPQDTELPTTAETAGTAPELAAATILEIGEPTPPAPSAAVPPQRPATGTIIAQVAAGQPASAMPPAPIASAMPPNAGKARETIDAEKQAQPQKAPKGEVQGQAGATAKSAAAGSVPALIDPAATSGGDGKQARGDQPSSQLPHQAGAEMPRGETTDILPPPHKPFQAALQHGADPSSPAPEAIGRSKLATDSPAQPDAEFRASHAPKGPETALQTPGLTTHASQTAVVHVGMAAAGATGTTPAAVIPQAPAVPVVPLAGLAVEIAAAAHAGKQRFEIRLDPPELGRIDVRLDVDREGNVTSRMTVERADTLDLLRRDSSQLERALQQAGLKTSDHALEFSLRQQAFARHEHAPENAARLIVNEDDPPLEAVRHGYGRLLGMGGGLDIRV